MDKNNRPNKYLKARDKALRATILANKILGKTADSYLLSELDKLEKRQPESSYLRQAYLRAGLFIVFATVAYALFSYFWPK